MDKTSELRCGDIVFYTDEVGKKRPLVYLKTVNDGRAIVGVKCTSKFRNYDPYSYYVEDWKESGFMKETTVRCDNVRFLSDCDLHRYRKTGEYEYVGRLSNKSLSKVVSLFEAYSDELKSLAQDVKGEKVYAIKEIERLGRETSTTFRIFDNKENACEMFKLCSAETTKIICNGKIVNVNRTFELGTVSVINKNEVDENSFKQIAESSPSMQKRNAMNWLPSQSNAMKQMNTIPTVRTQNILNR